MGHPPELRIALNEGILAEDEIPALEREAVSVDKSPLELLRERGRLSEETYASLCAQAREADLDSFPIPGWDRYEPLRLLGQGGMGRVFLARDLRLGRDVALKFVRGEDPELSRRIVLEARAQARLRHPRVCQVYEVGEARGKVYIAMQHIDGRPLSALAPALSAAQVAAVVRDVSLGVQAAHEEGLIHRDLKPANILVERAADGRLEPYVVDFGLARSATDSATVTGSVLGTPPYMSPEQARGEVSALDARADVYGLGATLYSALTGAPPVPGDNALEVLSRVATFEPRPPRALNPGVPVDLEAIVLKCLEKDRSARYGSARALADDLGRFLAGEPVLARPGGCLDRLRRRLKKHARAAAVVAAAFVLVLGAIGFGVRERARAAERERLTRHFTAVAEQVESRARYAMLSRSHDIRPEMRSLQAEMDALEAEVTQAGPVALGSAHTALGRGFLAIGDELKARRYLESAWQLGDREPRVAHGLALVMARLFQRASLEVERTPGAEVRAARRAEIERLYRDPALLYLRQSEGAGVSSEYVAAQIAFCEGRFEDALARVGAVGSGSPWFYEAPRLKGEILLARAVSRWNNGEHEAARGDIEEGRTAFSTAAAAADSSPSAHEALGELEYAALMFELYSGGNAAGPFERGMAAVGRALAADAAHHESLVLRARLRRSMAEYNGTRGSDATELLAAAVADAERAAAGDPGRRDAHLELAAAYRQWGDDRQSRGEDPGPQLRKALAVSDRIAAEDRDDAYHINVGLIHQAWADHQDQVGADSSEHRDEAIMAYRRALALQDRAARVWLNLGINYFSRASQPGSPDAEGDLLRAAEAFDRGRSINPGHIVPYFYGGEIHRALARRLRDRGGDPAPDLSLALASYRGGLAVDPKLPHLYNGIGAVLMEQAAEAWDRGASPDALLGEALASFEQAIAVAPDQGYGYHNVGDALARRALHQRARGEDAAKTIQAAIAAEEKAIARIPGNAAFWATLGTMHTIAAGDAIARGRDPAPAPANAKAALDRALAINPKSPQARVYMAEAQGLAALWKARSGKGDPGELEDAARAFQQGLDLAPERQDHALLFGRFCRAWGLSLKESGRDPGAALKWGLAIVNGALAARPGWADALALQAALWLAQAQTAPDPAARRDLGRRAAEGLAEALSINGNLSHEWGRSHKLAERLAAPAR